MERIPRSINQRRVFVDTSAFVANVDRHDRHHAEAGTALERLLTGRYRLFTTMYVVVEAHASILRASTPAVGHRFLVEGLQGVSPLPTTTGDEEAAKNLILRQRDKDYSFCDAISFVVMERLGLYLAFAYDDHFRQAGFSTPLAHRDWP